MISLTKPARLKIGDTIGIVTPSEPVAEERLERYHAGIDSLTDKGFKVRVGEHVLSNRDNYVSASNKERAEDINKMFWDEEVRAILCTTGGYNSNGVLPYLNYDLMKTNPKIFVGLSDPSAIINAIHKKTGLVTFHGPAVLSDYGKGIHPYTEEYFTLATSNTSPIGEVRPLSTWETISPGNARGRIVGGNLSTLQLLIGTEYEPEWDGAILFWEDIGVEPQNLENRLVQFRQLGILDKIKGMVVGRCVDCDMKSYKNQATIPQVVREVCQGYNFPILYNVDLGHTREKITIPLGLDSSMDASKLRFSILESAVV